MKTKGALGDGMRWTRKMLVAWLGCECSDYADDAAKFTQACENALGRVCNDSYKMAWQVLEQCTSNAKSRAALVRDARLYVLSA